MSGIGFFVVTGGEAAVSVDGAEVATLAAGATTSGSRRSTRRETVTVTARTELRCLEIPFPEFRKFARANPDVTWKLLQHVVATLQRGASPRLSDRGASARGDGFSASPSIAPVQVLPHGFDEAGVRHDRHVPATGNPQQDASRDEPLCLLEDCSPVEAVAGAGRDERWRRHGAVAASEVERVLRLDRGGEVGEVADAPREGRLSGARRRASDSAPGTATPRAIAATASPCLPSRTSCAIRACTPRVSSLRRHPVLARTSRRTVSGWSAASCCARLPPVETPSTSTGPRSSATIAAACSEAISANVIPSGSPGRRLV